MLLPELMDVLAALEHSGTIWRRSLATTEFGGPHPFLGQNSYFIGQLPVEGIEVI